MSKDYEKKYNEALGRARKAYNAILPENRGARKIIEDAFPELRESEDERIRKIITDSVFYQYGAGAEYKDVLDYLDKFEKQKEYVSEKFDDVWALESCEELIAEGEKLSPRFKELFKDVCHAWYDKGIEVGVKQKEPHYTKRNALFDKCVAECDPAVMKEVSDEIDEMLEKEQKPNIELIQRSWYMEGYHDREFGKEPKWIIKTGEGGPKHELNPRYGQPLAGQQPTEEQKPASTEDMYIADEHFYERTPADSFKYKLAEYMTKNYRKVEGPYGHTYAISAETILEMAKEELLKMGVVQKPSIFPVGIGEVHWNPISPEQVKQRQLEWKLPDDFEEAVYKVANFISPFNSQEELRKTSHCFAEQLMSLAKKELAEKTAVWRPYDKEVLTKIKELIDSHFSEHEQREVYKDWLDEHISQPAGWSDEDEEIRQSIIKDIEFERNYISATTGKVIGKYDEQIVWLKSLRPSWKPSEEQMEALNALNCHGDLSYVGQQNQLISLYNDLKKLKG